MKHGRGIGLARSLRRRQTEQEKILWEHLRDRRFFGFKFRRQVPCGHYVLDFFCEEVQVAVELDSPSHVLHVLHDAQRDAYIAGQGAAVLRLLNDEITAPGAPGLARLESLLRARHAQRRR